MTKLEIDFKCNLPLNVSREHRLEAERRATQIFVLALLEMGSLNIAKAAELLGIDRHAVVQMAIDRGIYTREIDSMRLSIDPEAIAYTLKEEPKMLKTGFALDREAIAYTNHQAKMFEDTGVDYNHQDLADNIWTNPGEIPNNGIDDDDNGFTDDFYGWDWVNQDNEALRYLVCYFGRSKSLKALLCMALGS